MNKPNIKAYHGTYHDVYILLEDGNKIAARAYASNHDRWQDRIGYFNVWFIEGWSWGVIFQAVFTDGL